VSSRKLAPREQVLIVAGAFAVLGAGELLLRVLPRRKEIGALDARIAQLQAGLTPAPRPAPDAELQRLVARRDVLRKTVATDRAALSQLAASFGKDEQAALVAVSELASRRNVLVRESEPYGTARDDIGRPRRRFVVIASFEALRSFLADLATLPQGPVHLERFDVEAVALPAADGEGEDDLADRHVLLGTFVLVL
jgi:hypothetical protein